MKQALNKLSQYDFAIGLWGVSVGSALSAIAFLNIFGFSIWCFEPLFTTLAIVFILTMILLILVCVLSKEGRK